MDPEIRCVAGKVDTWEVVSSERCCVFVWDRLRDTGVVVLDSQQCAACRAEVRSFAETRGWRVIEA